MKRSRAFLAAVALALAVTACGSDDDGEDSAETTAPVTTTETEAPGPGASAEAVAWSEQVCTDMKPALETLTQQPDLGDMSDPADAQQSLVAYIDDVVGAIGTIKTAFNDAGDPPVEGGEGMVAELDSTLSQAEEALTSARDTVEAADPNDQEAFAEAMAKVAEDMTAMGEAMQAADVFSEMPELEAASQEAPTCQEIQQF